MIDRWLFRLLCCFIFYRYIYFFSKIDHKLWTVRVREIQNHFMGNPFDVYVLAEPRDVDYDSKWSRSHWRFMYSSGVTIWTMINVNYLLSFATRVKKTSYRFIFFFSLSWLKGQQVIDVECPAQSLIVSSLTNVSKKTRIIIASPCPKCPIWRVHSGWMWKRRRGGGFRRVVNVDLIVVHCHSQSRRNIIWLIDWFSKALWWWWWW